MVKRWQDDECDPYMAEKLEGQYVLYSDYHDLREALREALDGWEGWVDVGIPESLNEQDRIDQLRSLYLGGGEND